jgi:hypothetical protein
MTFICMRFARSAGALPITHHPRDGSNGWIRMA